MIKNYKIMRLISYSKNEVLNFENPLEYLDAINAVIDICSESNNEEVLNSTFVIVACSFAFFRWHPSKQETIKIFTVFEWFLFF